MYMILLPLDFVEATTKSYMKLMYILHISIVNIKCLGKKLFVLL